MQSFFLAQDKVSGNKNRRRKRRRRNEGKQKETSMPSIPVVLEWKM
jgi:hypothetical protein